MKSRLMKEEVVTIKEQFTELLAPLISRAYLISSPVSGVRHGLETSHRATIVRKRVGTVCRKGFYVAGCSGPNGTTFEPRLA